MPDESTRTVLVALGTGLAVTLAKVGAAVLTGSTAMSAEAAHSLADNAKDLSLFVAQRDSTASPRSGVTFSGTTLKWQRPATRARRMSPYAQRADGGRWASERYPRSAKLLSAQICQWLKPNVHVRYPQWRSGQAVGQVNALRDLSPGSSRARWSAPGAQFRERLLVNVGIALVFGASYLRFLKRS